jgi:hypothetical protein
MFLPVEIPVDASTPNIDPIASPGSGAIGSLMLLIPRSDKNLAAPNTRVVLVSTVAMTVDVYVADDASIPTGSDGTPTTAVLAARKFYIGQTALSLVANTLAVLTVPYTGWLYFRVTTPPGSAGLLRGGAL